MSVAEVARALGYPVTTGRAGEKRLMRYLRQRERLLGVEILQRIGTDRVPRYRVTFAALRAHCPEMFDTRVELTELLREQVAEIDEKLNRLDRQDELLAEELERLAGGPR
ncbi:MAG: hypothetical protein ACXVEE_35010 [Polyangiales bacterium]